MAIFEHNKKVIRGGLSRATRISIAGVGVFLVVAHISMHLAGHIFHHTH